MSIVKGFYQDQIRLFEIESLSMENLQWSTTQAFNIVSTAQPVFSYVDDDGDWIRVDSDAELTLAFQAKGSPLKLKIQCGEEDIQVAQKVDEKAEAEAEAGDSQDKKAKKSIMLTVLTEEAILTEASELLSGFGVPITAQQLANFMRATSLCFVRLAKCGLIPQSSIGNGQGRMGSIPVYADGVFSSKPSKADGRDGDEDGDNEMEKEASTSSGKCSNPTVSVQIDSTGNPVPNLVRSILATSHGLDLSADQLRVLATVLDLPPRAFVRRLKMRDSVDLSAAFGADAAPGGVLDGSEEEETSCSDAERSDVETGEDSDTVWVEVGPPESDHDMGEGKGKGPRGCKGKGKGKCGRKMDMKGKEKGRGGGGPNNKRVRVLVRLVVEELRPKSFSLRQALSERNLQDVLYGYAWNYGPLGGGGRGGGGGRCGKRGGGGRGKRGGSPFGGGSGPGGKRHHHLHDHPHPHPHPHHHSCDGPGGPPGRGFGPGRGGPPHGHPHHAPTFGGPPPHYGQGHGHGHGHGYGPAESSFGPRGRQHGYGHDHGQGHGYQRGPPGPPQGHGHGHGHGPHGGGPYGGGGGGFGGGEGYGYHGYGY